jgi:hypothetical protein
MKITGWLLGVSVCLLFCRCATESSGGATLEEIAREFNKKCPQMIDSETKIDGIEIKEPNTIVYNYTLVNLFKQKVDTAEFNKALRPGLISVIKLSPEMKKLRDNNTNFEYAYYDKLHTFIYLFKILPTDYNNK